MIGTLDFVDPRFSKTLVLNLGYKNIDQGET